MGVQLRELMLAAVSSIKTLFGPATEEVDDTVGDDPVSVPTWRKLLRLTGKAPLLGFLGILFCIKDLVCESNFLSCKPLINIILVVKARLYTLNSKRAALEPLQTCWTCP